MKRYGSPEDGRMGNRYAAHPHTKSHYLLGTTNKTKCVGLIQGGIVERDKKRKRRFLNTTNQTTMVGAEGINHLIKQIQCSGKISRSQHVYLMSSLLSNDTKAQEYSSLINRILEATRAGTLQLID